MIADFNAVVKRYLILFIARERTHTIESMNVQLPHLSRSSKAAQSLFQY